MKRTVASRLGMLIDEAAVCMENTSTLLIELADNAMYQCEEEVVVPSKLARRISGCSERMNMALDELLLKISM